MLILGSILYISSLCTQCGTSIDPSITRAIIQVESGGNPYAIGDNTTRKSYYPESQSEAVQLAADLISQGHNLDMGLMQINSWHLGRNGVSLESVFEPCDNIKTGTGILSGFLKKYDGQPQAFFKALSAYNTGSAWKGPAFINRILKASNAPYRVAVVNPPKERKAKRPRVATVEYSPGRAGTVEGSSIFFSGGNL